MLVTGVVKCTFKNHECIRGGVVDRATADKNDFPFLLEYCYFCFDYTTYVSSTFNAVKARIF